MKLNIPYHKQENDYYCGPAVLQMVFEFLGIKKSQEELANELGTTEKYGTSNKAMIEATSAEGFNVIDKEGATIDEVKDFIKQNLPVIVDFIEPTDNLEHFAIVTGFENRDVVLNDPYNGQDFKISEEDFLNRWDDPVSGYKQWIMIISE